MARGDNGLNELRTYIEMLLEKRFAQSQTFYHGTSTKFLRSIMVNGLQADPRERAFGYSEDDDGWDDGHRRVDPDGIPIETVGGIYMTKNPSEAKTYADNASNIFIGEPMVVQLQITEESTLLDEDTYRNIILNFAYDSFGEALGLKNQSRMYMYGDMISSDSERTITRAAAAIFIQKLEDKFEQKIVRDDNGRKAMHDLCYAAFMISLVGGWMKEEDFIDAFESNGKDEEEAQEALQDYVWPLDEPASEAEQHEDWYSGMALFTNTVRTKQEKTRRTEQDIGFRGRNKITAIVVIDHRTRTGYLVYGKPDESLTQFINIWADSVEDYRGKSKEWPEETML